MRVSDEQLADELRFVLDGVDQALARQPSPTPPWAQIRDLIQRSRTRRRRRITLAVATAALVAVGLVVAQNRLFPFSDEGFQPVPTAPPFAEWDTPRGSLADDQEWLSQFEEWVATHPSENDGIPATKPDPEPAENIQVLYASDLGDFRVAVVVGDWVSRPERTVTEFYGRRGAPPEEMLAGRGGPAPDLTEGPDTYRSVLFPGLSVRGLADSEVRKMRSSAYLLTDGAPEIYLQQPPTIDADGEVTQHTRLIEFQDGVAELTFDQPGHYAVFAPNQEQGFGDLSGLNTYHDFFSFPEETFSEAVEMRPARGGTRPSAKLGKLTWLTWNAARQSVSQGDWQLLAAEPGDLSVNGPARAVAGVLTLPSGGRVVAAGHMWEEMLTVNNVEIASTESDLDIAGLLPEGDDGDVAIAWQIDRVDAHPARAAALGPADTVTVEWTTRSGEKITTPAVNTLAVVARDDVSEARFLDGDGDELGKEKIRAAQARRFNTTPAVDKTPDQANGGWWLLPEIKDGLAGF